MIDILNYNPESLAPKLSAILSRTTDFSPEQETATREIVATVREKGDQALLAYTKKFDGVDLQASDLRVPESEIEAAYRQADPNLLSVIEAAAANIRRFHEAQKRTSWFIEDGDGVILGKRVVPIERVALLIPGASAPLFSTLLMAAIPAQIAGVPYICVATPPQPNGHVHPAVLAAAHVVGITQIYKVFGAQAISALAYGTESIPRVDKLVGPGNPYVQIAKKLVFGTVDIDMVAGPSEIVVVADETAKANHIAGDLLSQAEHGSGFESAVCITPSAKLAEEVAREITAQAADLSNKDAIQKALDRFGAIVIVKDIPEGIDLSNRIAPEHLELMVADPWAHLQSVQHAGAVFMGPASSEPVGDYYAGTNHILPTAGAARFASSVGVDTFIKTISIVHYTEERLKKTAGHIITLAEAEGLDGHANAIRQRL
ncbi:MAG: histidinol dehydrogenase [Candidatus Latescibacterota bacterium]|jgi:histidinol dehydrogenase